MCSKHNRRLEIICIDDKQRICPNCALFGPHKNHDIRMEAEVMTEIQVRTECLMEMYMMIEQNQACIADARQVEESYTHFTMKANDLKQ